MNGTRVQPQFPLPDERRVAQPTLEVLLVEMNSLLVPLPIGVVAVRVRAVATIVRPFIGVRCRVSGQLLAGHESELTLGALVRSMLRVPHRHVVLQVTLQDEALFAELASLRELVEVVAFLVLEQADLGRVDLATLLAGEALAFSFGVKSHVLGDSVTGHGFATGTAHRLRSRQRFEVAGVELVRGEDSSAERANVLS